MNNWHLLQYQQIVNSFINSCDSQLQTAILGRLDLLSEKGNQCKRPISAPLGDGIFELRAAANGRHTRLLYFFEPGQKIIFVNALFKTTRETPKREIDIAKRNRKIIKERSVILNGISYLH